MELICVCVTLLFLSALPLLTKSSSSECARCWPDPEESRVRRIARGRRRPSPVKYRVWFVSSSVLCCWMCGAGCEMCWCGKERFEDLLFARKFAGRRFLLLAFAGSVCGGTWCAAFVVMRARTGVGGCRAEMRVDNVDEDVGAKRMNAQGGRRKREALALK